MTLRKYHDKRDFEKTAEPEGTIGTSVSGTMFVVQKHAARRLHYDLRLEAEGVLKSWAVPKGPSYEPSEKRLAVQVEDHPIDYGDFEGMIPEHQYGAGTVMVWDHGTWEPVGDLREGLEKGKLVFALKGQKLRGEWTLVRIKTSRDPEKPNWLLIKHEDQESLARRGYDVTLREPLSAKTGRSMEEIRSSENPEFWQSKGAEDAEIPHLPVLLSLPPPPAEGKPGPWPDILLPQMSTLVTAAPEGSEWIYEIKYDGYRILSRIRDSAVQLTTRRGLDWTEKFLPIARELSSLRVGNAIMDGEVVIEDQDGTSNFQKLQNYLKGPHDGSLLYYVFDLLYYEGRDLSRLPLLRRKELLSALISRHADDLPSVRYSEHLTGDGRRIFDAACSHKVEGIVAKRADSPYQQARTRNWLKVKCIKRQEFVICGYTDPQGGRTLFGSLLLGYYDEHRRLVYCGNVGTGFDSRSLRSVYDVLRTRERESSPFQAKIEDALRRKVHWVAPEVVAEVEFGSWTDAGMIRHASFIGLREDRNADEVGRERALAAAEFSVEGTRNTKSRAVSSRVVLSNPEKVLYPESGITKEALAGYYLKAAKRMLPEIMGRPLTLVRCPEGIQGECFFQKHITEEVPPGLGTVAIREKDETGVYLVVEDTDGLLSLVQMGVLEIHVWGSRAAHLEYPDRMVLDLDPSPEISKPQLLDATHFIRDWLIKNGVEPLFKTTGGKGVHIVVPLQPTLNWQEVRKISEGIAAELVALRPETFLATVTKSKRIGKILIDYFRNTRGATSIAPYSTRARPGAPVALPVAFEELEALLSFPPGIQEALPRLERSDNPWRVARKTKKKGGRLSHLP